jgi:hypothetical protein
MSTGRELVAIDGPESDSWEPECRIPESKSSCGTMLPIDDEAACSAGLRRVDGVSSESDGFLSGLGERHACLPGGSAVEAYDSQDPA